MNPDDSEHSFIWYKFIGPRVRSDLALAYLSQSEVELNPQPIPPGKNRGDVMVDVLEAVALYRAAGGAGAENQAGIQRQVAKVLREAADRIGDANAVSAGQQA